MASNERWRADRLDTRLRQGRLEAQHIRAIAVELARWHSAEAPPREESAAHPDALARRLASACERAETLAPGRAITSALRTRLERALAAERDHFVARAADACLRRVHGCFGPEAAYVNASAEASIVEPDRPSVGDPVADVARMVVALRRAGRADLAERFVAAYAQSADDFAAYRAIALHEGIAACELAGAANDATDAARWLLQASAPTPATRPQLVAVGGRKASGKSTIAARLAAELGAPLVSAHALLAPGGDDWSTFLALARRAEPVLDAGHSVVLDAGFSSQAMRRGAAKLARDRGAPFLFTECCASEDTRRRRLAQRAGAWDPASDEWEPVRDLDGGVHVVVDTTRPKPRGFARVRRVLPSASQLVA